jgi:hypothetical protein
MPECITNANDALLPEIVHKHRVQRSASMTDIGKAIQDTAALKPKRNGKINTSVVKIYNFFRKVLIINIQNYMFLVVFSDKSDRFADLPYSAAMKMASVGEPFRPDQSTISTKIMAKTLTNTVAQRGHANIF